MRAVSQKSQNSMFSHAPDAQSQRRSSCAGFSAGTRELTEGFTKLKEFLLDITHPQQELTQRHKKTRISNDSTCKRCAIIAPIELCRLQRRRSGNSCETHELNVDWVSPNDRQTDTLGFRRTFTEGVSRTVHLPRPRPRQC